MGWFNYPWNFDPTWLLECDGYEKRKSPNDPKLSDGRGWRDRCAAGERRRPEAAGVTAAPVRCSALLGVADVGKEAL